MAISNNVARNIFDAVKSGSQTCLEVSRAIGLKNSDTSVKLNYLMDEKVLRRERKKNEHGAVCYHWYVVSEKALELLYVKRETDVYLAPPTPIRRPLIINERGLYDVTADFCGDPLPHRSALNRRGRSA